ncbi:MAG: hypothetical protein WBD99_14510 [Thermodesulfobacteriota bacterium]
MDSRDILVPIGFHVIDFIEDFRLLLCTCAEPCPDDRSGSIQYQDKEVREKKNKLNEENTCAVQSRQKHAYEGEGNYEVKT